MSNMIKKEVEDHMIGYVEERLQTSDLMHTLGYLDTPHWKEAAIIYKGQEKHLEALKALAKQVDKRYDTDFFGDIESALYPIYFIVHKGFPDYFAICTKIEQYGFDPQNKLFKYHNHIMVNRPVNYKEAKMLLELVKHNGSGELCGGEVLEKEQL